MLRLDDGAQLVGLPTKEPLFWRTGLGLLEISPDRLTLTSRYSNVGGLTVYSPRPLRLRLTDGTLWTGWPLRTEPASDTVRLQLEDGAEHDLTLTDVMEINDLPRSGPAEAIPLPGRASQPHRLGSGVAQATRRQLERARAELARAKAKERKSPRERRKKRKRRKGVSLGTRAGQVGLGYCGMFLGGILGAGGLALATRSEDAALVGAFVGVPIGTALAVDMVGDQGGGEGTFLASLGGALAGTLVSTAILARKRGDALLIFVPVAPLLGGMIGYLGSDS